MTTRQIVDYAIDNYNAGPDGIAVHINSRGYTYADVHSTAKVNGQYFSFYVYKDWVNLGTPSSMRTLPYYATECNGVYYWKGGHPECSSCSNPSCCYQTDWIEWIYAEIDSWNQAQASSGERMVVREGSATAEGCQNRYSKGLGGLPKLVKGTRGHRAASCYNDGLLGTYQPIHRCLNKR